MDIGLGEKGQHDVCLARCIDIQDSEQISRAIKLTDPDVATDLILHTPGGLGLASEQIAYALCRHRAKVCVFVPHYAMSGGRLIARAGDELVMDENAVLGPIDPQIGQRPAVSILNVVEQTPIAEVDDQTLIWADLARKAIKPLKRTTVDILSHHMHTEKARQLTRAQTSGNWTHDYPVSVGEAVELGLSVSTDVSREAYDTVSPIRPTAQRRPAVEYMPVPYRSPDGTEAALREPVPTMARERLCASLSWN